MEMENKDERRKWKMNRGTRKMLEIEGEFKMKGNKVNARKHNFICKRIIQGALHDSGIKQ